MFQSFDLRAVQLNQHWAVTPHTMATLTLCKFKGESLPQTEGSPEALSNTAVVRLLPV